VVEEINTELCRRLPLDSVRVCYHDDADSCACRKPAPGLLLAAAADLEIDLSRSYMIGDRWGDIEAGRRAGCQTILVGDSLGKGQIERSLVADYYATSLVDAADRICAG